MSDVLILGLVNSVAPILTQVGTLVVALSALIVVVRNGRKDRAAAAEIQATVKETTKELITKTDEIHILVNSNLDAVKEANRILKEQFAEQSTVVAELRLQVSQLVAAAASHGGIVDRRQPPRLVPDPEAPR